MFKPKYIKPKIYQAKIYQAKKYFQYIKPKCSQLRFLKNTPRPNPHQYPLSCVPFRGLHPRAMFPGYRISYAVPSTPIACWGDYTNGHFLCTERGYVAPPYLVCVCNVKGSLPPENKPRSSADGNLPFEC